MNNPSTITLGTEEAPIGNGITPRLWKAVGITFAAKYTKERRVPILIYITDQNTGKLKTVTVAYAVGPNKEIALYRAQKIQEAVNASGGSL